MTGIERVTWSQLAKWQRSFGSKAAIALPIIGFVFASLPGDWLRARLADNWRIHVVFWGAVLFLIGQAVIWHRRPIEFARDTDVHQDIAEARRFASFDIFKNKVDLLARLITRIEAARSVDEAVLILAKARLKDAQAATETDWKQHLPKVIIAQRTLREVDDKAGRVGSVILLGIGTLMMGLPTALNIIVTGWTLLKGYVTRV